ncbi:MAG TPA: DNA mismatch repair endonuclease MutL, partial [Victivallales bacterium]|nr:DNA mismatch repair endonuclease MutL [Victivallales bacterium]
MANKIIILPDPIINKIAAGEVIERPASVLKELIENSLDAQSNRINIIVEGAGVKFISVTDNGCGMSADDALLCIEPHATSKITAAEDLNTIQTFGFRGEALPSIASVSKFRLRTRTHDSKEGTEIFVNGGKLIESKPTGCPEGTEVTVRELFFNVPARRKFLSSPQVE